MVALYDPDELARSGGNLNNHKAVTLIPQTGLYGSEEVTFQRKNSICFNIFFSLKIFVHFYRKHKNILFFFILAYQLKKLEGRFVFVYVRSHPFKFAFGKSSYYFFTKPQVVSYFKIHFWL